MSSGYSKELNVQNVRYFMNFQVVQRRDTILGKASVLKVGTGWAVEISPSETCMPISLPTERTMSLLE